MSMGVTEDILIETVGAVATVRLNRGAKRNALTMAMYARLADGLAGLSEDADVRVIVLTGSDGSFTAGNDLRDMAEAGDLDEDSPPRRFLDALVALPQVLVVGVAGAAIGIGTSVILHADLVYASSSSIFALPFVNLGLVPEAASTLLLPAVTGHVRAAELLLLGERFDAEQALRWGLINEMLDGGQAELDEHLAMIAAKLAAQPAESLLQTRRLLRTHRTDSVGARLQEDGMIMRKLAAVRSARMSR
jgi:enoyl-CoA hydratase/carnithine racemase